MSLLDRRSLDGKSLIFLQHSRTAGNTMCAILEESFGRENVFKLGVQFGPGDGARQGAGANLTYSDFRRTAPAGRHQAFVGHFWFGAHRHVPRPCDYITLLRDPVHRVLSRHGAWHRDMPVMEWLGNHPETANRMTKRLIGIGPSEDERGFWDYVEDRPVAADVTVGEAEFDRALDIVDGHFSLVLSTHHYVESLVLLQRTYGTGTLFSLNRQFFNHSPTPTRPDEYPREVIDRITELNQWDMRLHAHFEDRIQAMIAAQDATFAEDVRILRMINEILSERGMYAITSERAYERLLATLDSLVAVGRTHDAAAIAQRFLDKEGEILEWRRALLDFVRRHAAIDEHRFGT